MAPATARVISSLHRRKVQEICDSVDAADNGRTHQSEPDLHHWIQVRPMVLERYRVFDDHKTGRLCGADEDTVDGLVGVFEGMEDEFAVCEVFEAKVRACHGVKDGWARI
jgi:hypothetical protein